MKVKHYCLYTVQDNFVFLYSGNTGVVVQGAKLSIAYTIVYVHFGQLVRVLPCSAQPLV